MLLVALSLNGLFAVNTDAQLNFRATYFELETSEELVLKSDWLTITYPADEGDILPFLLPKISDFWKKRAAVARDQVGIFPVEFSFGTKPVEEFGRTGLHYTITSSADYWVDDVKSTFYNRLVNTDAPKIRRDWSSAETLWRSDGLYDLVIVVGHIRSPKIIQGRGSAIFLHRWSAPGKPTIGCTALAPDNLQKLWSWLDAKKMPLLVQGPRDFVKRLSPPPIA